MQEIRSATELTVRVLCYEIYEVMVTKIALVSNVLPQVGGVGTFINALADGLRRDGHSVSIVTVLGCRPRFLFLSGPFLQVLLSALKLGPFTVAAFFLTELLLALSLRLAHRRHHYDIIHAQDVSAANAAAGLRVPLILTMHGLLSEQGVGGRRPSSWSRAIFRAAERRAFKRADGIVAVSDAGLEHIDALAPGRNVSIIRNLVPDEFYPPRQEENRTLPIKVLFAGRLVHSKGAHVLLEALTGIEPGLVELLIAGDGPEGPALRLLAAKLSVEEAVKFLGPIPPAEMRALMASVDAVALPSINAPNESEGTPMVLLEALASARPVVASAIRGISEIIQHGVNGLLVQPEDSRAWADALRRLATDQRLRQTLGQRGRQYSERTHSASRVVSLYLEVYRQALARLT